MSLATIKHSNILIERIPSLGFQKDLHIHQNVDSISHTHMQSSASF
jgi:hypothetical protein